MEGQAVFNKLTSPLAVRTALAEALALGREAFLEKYRFRHAKEYLVVVGGDELDSKAVAAVALGLQFDIPPLRADQCTAGKDYGHAAWALDRLGFEVRGIQHKGWWLHEVEMTVDAYLEMRVLQASGERFRKVDILRRLHSMNPSRSQKAYEYKFQNLSAALRDLDESWVEGFAPMSRYQLLLRFVLEERLGRVGASVKSEINEQPVQRLRLVSVDWAEQDAKNRELGKAGEKFVLEWERARLVAAQRSDLARRVRWLAQESDGHGYDIASFDPDGTAICIEVKTTAGNANAPFYVSSNELTVSRQRGNSYKLYRVSNFFVCPLVDIHVGEIGSQFSIVPSSYRALRKPD